MHALFHFIINNFMIYSIIIAATSYKLLNWGKLGCRPVSNTYCDLNNF